MSLSFQSKRNSWHSKKSRGGGNIEKKKRKAPNTKCRKRNTARERSRRDSDDSDDSDDCSGSPNCRKLAAENTIFKWHSGWGREGKGRESPGGKYASPANCHRLNFNLCEKRTTQYECTSTSTSTSSYSQ